MKKVIRSFLALVLVLVGIWFFETDKHEVLAAETTDAGFVSIEYTDVSAYRVKNNIKAPTYTDGKMDWIFAGWYQDEACTKAYTNISASTTLAYAKFVPTDVLSVRLQLTAGTDSSSSTTNMRLVSSVDSLQYSQVGFEIYYKGATTPIKVKVNKVYKRIDASAASGVDYNYSPKVLDAESQYFVTATLLNIANKNFGYEDSTTNFYIKPYWKTLDGTTVYGVNRYVNVKNGIDQENVNIPVKMDEKPTSPTVTVGGTTYDASVAYYDGTYAHMNITVASRNSVLKSLSTVNVTGENTAGSAVYRNLLATYNGVADTSWYDIPNAQGRTKFSIATSADLYGLASVVNKSTDNFTNKAVYVVSDIMVNNGQAADWSSAGPSYSWTAIGSTSYPYNGVFDGQMHTISGLYLNVSSNYQGLFAATATNAEVRNFYLKNSYFKVTSTDSNRGQLGSIVGNTRGIFENIYSDAIVDGYCNRVGGLFGGTSSSGGFTASNCWFAGSATINSAASYLGGLVGHISYGSTIKNCLNTGVVDHKYSVGTAGIGGFVGYASANVSILDSVNHSNVTRVGGTYFGLFVGRPGGTITLDNSHSISYSKHFVGSANGTDDTSSQYTTCSRQNAADVAGLKSLSVAKVKELFNSETAKGYWSITQNSLPILSTFEQGSNMAGQAVDTSWYDESVDEYILKDSGDLYGFALLSQTNTFEGKTIKLGADIEANRGKATATGWDTSQNANGESITNGTDFLWMPIGTTSIRFNGVFDGQMHTISGIYLNATTMYQGLFSGTDTKAEIKNFYLKNSYFTSTNDQLGSIVGNAKGTTLNKVYSDAIVAGYSGCDMVGGMIGATSDGGGVTMNDCWFAGSATINGAASYLGGLIGRVTYSSTITNCLNTGIVNHAYTGTLGTAGIGGLVGYALGSVTISDSVNYSNPTRGGGAYFGLIVGRPGGTITLTNSHSISYSKHLVGSSSGTDDTSSQYTTCSRQSASAVAGLNSLTTAKVKELFLADTTKGHWSITQDSLPVLSVFETGSNVIAQAVDTSWYDESVDEYILKDSGDLYGFALLSQTNTFTGKTIKLGANIEVNRGKATATGWDTTQNANGKSITNGTDFSWMPIGTTSIRFNGVFNGQMHTISGIYLNATATYQGLFSGTGANAQIRNFYLKNSYFTSTGYDYLGSVVGNAMGTFERIYSDAIVAGYGSCDYVGGMVGTTSTSGGVILNECWFAGSATINGAASYLGGIAGAIAYQSTITNCLNTGIVNHAYTGTLGTAGIGGFVGYAPANVSILDSVNYSNPTRGGGAYFGLLVGRPGGTITLDNSHSISYSKHFIGSSSGTDDTSSQYTTCSRQSVSAVAGIKSLTTAKVKELFLSDTAKGHWSITTDSLPILTIFAKEANVETQAVDTNWYDSSKSSYELKDAADLYGLAVLSNVTDINGFAGKTITLGTDITLNEDMTAPDFEWLCIGGIGSPTPRFAGTFDGKMHTIKGLYVNTTSSYVGLFSGTASTAKIQNLRLVDSKLQSTGTDIGSIAGSAMGEFKNIYSEAVVENNQRYIGGLIGSICGENAILEKCWFAGTVRSTNVGGTVNNVGAGGLVGNVNNESIGDLTLLNCLNSGTVDVSAYVNHVAVVAGGLIGWIQNQTDVAIDGCLVSGTMIGNNTITHSFGPIAGSVTLENTDGTQSSLSISRTYAVNDIPQKNSTRVEEDSFVYVDKNEIIGDVAKDKMPLLFNSFDWKCVEGEYPILDFSTEQEKEDLTATNNDETQLSALYADRQLYQGEMHNHAYTYGRGQGAGNPGDDGEVTLTTWKEQMLAYGLDFAASLDHNQSDHINHTEWETNKFVYGTELGATITDDAGITTIGTLHMDMIFKTKQQLDDFISAHPSDFELSGGYFYGGTFTKAEFKTFIKDVIQAGGFFNLPHPLQNDEYTSKDMNDYYFEVKDEMQKQLIYGMHVITWDVNNTTASLANYALWVNMLSEGYRVYATAGSDNHANLTPYTLTSIYASTCKDEKCTGDCGNTDCTGYDKGNMIPILQQGDFVAGSAGVRMSIGTTTMGGTCDFINQRVVVDVEKIHTIANDLNDKYRIDVINEHGVVYSKKLALDSNGVAEGIELAFNADAESAFYRVVVYNATTGTRIAIGNPIWNANK